MAVPRVEVEALYRLGHGEDDEEDKTKNGREQREPIEKDSGESEDRSGKQR